MVGAMPDMLLDVPIIEVLRPLGLALALGLLVGVQRQYSGHVMAGVRTFTLATLLGATCALMSPFAGVWMTGAGLLGVAGLAIVGHARSEESHDGDQGLTTEVALVLMYSVGAMTVHLDALVPVAVGVSVAILLHAKAFLHALAARLTEHEIQSILTFALISMVVLPLLPTEKFGPYGVLSLRNIWLMVVLVSGISLAGYAVQRVYGGRHGVLVAGLLGGAVSSTATTASYSRRARAGTPVLVAAFVITAATTIAWVRVLIVVGAVSRPLLTASAGPVGVLLGVATVVAGFVWFRVRKQEADAPPAKNPVEFKAALIFAGLYALVLVAVAWASDAFGEGGTLIVAAVSGLTDVNAISLSTARLVESGKTDVATAWRPVVVAGLSNQLFKLGMVGVIAGPRLFRVMAFITGVNIAAGIVLLLVWPT